MLDHPLVNWILRPRIFSLLLILGDVFLTQLIIRFISYTEIDWETYMVQVDLFVHGERNYSRITGPTGPLVYPAGHLYIHQALYYLTKAGSSVYLAQHIYSALYIVFLCLAHIIYRQSNIPFWVLPLLHSSKRLHSIFVLRLFNDCWSVVLMQVSILAIQNKRTLLASVFFSFALSVKMNVLLYLPGILLIVLKMRGLLQVVLHLGIILLIQIGIALPFLPEFGAPYLSSAFDFSRVFLYQWTVNWRFLPETIFLDSRFSALLLVGHLSCLIFFALSRWCSSDGAAFSFVKRAVLRPFAPAGSAPLSSREITTTLFTCNLIGIIFARSLHYQFYSWYSYQIPFLLWSTSLPIPLRVLAAVLLEYGWNVYPSTTLSSTVLLLTHIVLLVGVWYGRGTVPSNNENTGTGRKVKSA